VVLSPREARASSFGHFDLGLDGEGTFNTAANSDLNNYGAGFKIRFGDQFKLKYGIRLTPEVGYAFDHLFPEGALEPWNMNRVFAGARLGFGKWVVPTLYAHVGVGFRSVAANTNDILIQGTTTGFTLDTGVAVDFYLTRHFAIGPHAEFVDVGTTPVAPQWLAFGAHADIVF
jgi:hypothetical protein